VIPYCAVSLCDSIVNSPVRLILLQLLASVGLIFVSDWYSKVRAARRGSSIEELEALFALRDLRRRPSSFGKGTRCGSHRRASWAEESSDQKVGELASRRSVSDEMASHLGGRMNQCAR